MVSAQHYNALESTSSLFDEGDDDESLPITFVWGANLKRLTIKALVDLANPKLIMWFQDALAASAVTDTGMQPNAASTRWSEVDVQWVLKGDLDWYYLVKDT
jgi:hypothetical protein